jgi:hypothetical protein
MGNGQRYRCSIFVVVQKPSIHAGFREVEQQRLPQPIVVQKTQEKCGFPKSYRATPL